jgi:hypothetical protein
MKARGFPAREVVLVRNAQGIEAEIPQASGVGAEELERKARFFAAFPNCGRKKCAQICSVKFYAPCKRRKAGNVDNCPKIAGSV